MNAETGQVSGRAAELRRAFDEAFAAPPVRRSEQRESLIAIRVAGESLMVRTHEITGLARRARVVPVPTDVPELLGITAIRGALLAVYDLARLLGIGAPASEPAWLLLANPEAPVALAFEKFEGQMEVPRECICQAEESTTRECIRRVARIGTGVRLVIDVAELVEAVRRRARPSGSAQE